MHTHTHSLSLSLSLTHTHTEFEHFRRRDVCKHTYICMYVHTDVCVYIHMYVYISTGDGARQEGAALLSG